MTGRRVRLGEHRKHGPLDLRNPPPYLTSSGRRCWRPGAMSIPHRAGPCPREGGVGTKTKRWTNGKHKQLSNTSNRALCFLCILKGIVMCCLRSLQTTAGWQATRKTRRFPFFLIFCLGETSRSTEHVAMFHTMDGPTTSQRE